MASESIYRLYVEIAAADKFSGIFKSFASTARVAEAQMKSLQTAMKMMGMSSAEISQLNRELDGLARARQFDKVAQDLKAVGMQTDQIAKLNVELNRLADIQDKIASGKSLLMKGGLSIAAGAGLAAALIEPIKNAADLQKAMMQVQIATGANPAQMQQLTKNAMLSGIDTGLSAVMVSQVQKALAQSRLPLNALMDQNTFGEYLKFSDMLYQRNGTPVDESASAAVQMSHEYQLYKDPKQLTDFLNRLWQTLAVTHTTPQSFANIFSYYAGSANRLGLDAQSALSMESFLISSGLAGNGRSGGSDINNFLQRAATPASKAAAQAMEQYGLMKNGQSVFFQNGKFVGLDKQIDIMQKFSAQFHGNKAAEIGAIKTIFGEQGGRYALALSGGNAKDMNALLQKQIGAVPNIDKAQAMQMNTISGQLQRLKVAWQDVMTNLGMPQLSSATNFLKTINDILAKVVKFQIAHPALMKMAGDFVKITSAALIFRGSIMSIAGAGRMISGSFQLTKLFTDFTKLSGAAKFLIKDWGLVGGTFKIVGRSIGILGSWVGRLTGLSKVFSVFKSVGSVIKSVGSALTPFGSAIGNAAKAFGTLALNIGKSTVALVANAAKTVAVKTAQLAVAAATRVWAAVQAVLDVALDANPIGVVIVAIGALIAVIVLLVTHWRQVISVVESVWSEIQQFASWIASAFVNLWHQAVDWGRNLIQGLWNGISGMAGWFVSQITGFVGKYITGPIKSLLGIHSPSRVFMEFGGYLAQGLAIGMTNNAHLVSHAANHLSNATIPTSMGVMSGRGGGDIHIHEGAIQINGYNKDKKELAQELIAQLGGFARNSNMSTSIGPNKFAFL